MHACAVVFSNVPAAQIVHAVRATSGPTSPVVQPSGQSVHSAAPRSENASSGHQAHVPALLFEAKTESLKTVDVSGDELGLVLGDVVGNVLGLLVGDDDGTSEGLFDGLTEGRSDGALVGEMVVMVLDDAEGLVLGVVLGCLLGLPDGSVDGETVGDVEGNALGGADGKKLGLALGRDVGRREGDVVGNLDGKGVGIFVGAGVGAAVGLTLHVSCEWYIPCPQLQLLESCHLISESKLPPPTTTRYVPCAPTLKVCVNHTFFS